MFDSWSRQSGGARPLCCYNCGKIIGVTSECTLEEFQRFPSPYQRSRDAIHFPTRMSMRLGFKAVILRFGFYEAVIKSEIHHQACAVPFAIWNSSTTEASSLGQYTGFRLDLVTFASRISPKRCAVPRQLDSSIKGTAAMIQSAVAEQSRLQEQLAASKQGADDSVCLRDQHPPHAHFCLALLVGDSEVGMLARARS